MMDLVRRILYPAFVATIIATLWAMGHAQAMASQAYNRRYLPPVNPQMFQFEAVDEAGHSGGPDRAAAPVVFVEDF